MCNLTAMQIGAGPQNFVALVAGLYHLGALLFNGEVYMWGYNSNGQLGIGPATVGTGTLVAPTPAIFPAGTYLIALAAGSLHSGAIATNTSLWMWGANARGQLEIGSDIDQPLPQLVGNGYTGLGLGFYHSCAIKVTTLYGWGQDIMCATTDPNPTAHSDETPFLVASLGTNVKAVAGGNSFTVALLDNGTVWSWGDSNDDELGQGSTTVHPHCVPHQVAIPFPAIAVTAGNAQGCALADANVYCWGSNFNGELGDGHSGVLYDSITPLQVGGLTNIVAISTGSDQTYALVTGGLLYGWGSDQHCELLNATGHQGDQDTPKLLPTLPSNLMLISQGCSSQMACAVTL